MRLFLYDGDCSFCRRSVEKLKRVSQNLVVYQPYQEADLENREVSLGDLQKSVVFFDEDQRRYQAAHAIFKVFEMSGKKTWLMWLYKYLPGFSLLSELGYRFVAKNRSRF